MARAAALLAFLLAGCSTAHYPVNVPLSLQESAPRYARRDILGGPAPDGIFMHAAFSGGGARAAAMAYGVLEVLDATSFVREGRKTRLVDALGIIAGVSGGAVAAGAYAARNEDFFQELACGFLYRDIAGALTSRLVSPVTLHRLTSSRYGRVEVLAEILDAHLFSGRTYGDIARAGRRPMAILSATSMYDGERFEFTQERFDALCSDLRAFPISRAVAASMAVPGLLSPVVLWNHFESCPARAAIPGGPLFKPYAPPYLHLLDGGLSDNLGVRNTIETIDTFGGFYPTMREIDVHGIRKLVYIVVNAQNENVFEEAASADVPGIVRTLRSVADIPIERYSSLSLKQLRSRLAAWVNEVKAADDPHVRSHFSRDVELFFIEISLQQVKDPAERRYLLRLPTSLSLPREDIDRVRSAARTLVVESEEFRRLASVLGAEYPAPASAGKTPSCPATP